jgi:hypothetical protein
MRLLSSLILSLIFASLNLQAQDTTAVQPADTVVVQQDTLRKKENIFRRIGNDGKNTFLTIVHTYARPFHWQKRDFLRLGGALAISGAAMLVDKEVYSFMQRNRSGTLNDLEKIGDFLGQPEHNYPFMLTVWGTGVLLNNDWLRDTGIMVIASVSTSGLLQTIGKEAVGRIRPAGNRSPFTFRPFSNDAAYHSFPSGHTMLSVATSWILARQVNFVPLKVVFFAMPVITGASRVYVGAHWLSDILLGSALGIACAESVLRIYPALKQKNKVAFSLAPNGRGMSVVYKL